MMSARVRIMIAGAGSAAVLLGALGFQFIGGLAPCPLCIWQRWPHLVALVIALLAVTLLRRQRRVLSLLGMAAVLFGAGVAVYHAGIERKWWTGPDTCTSGDISALTTDQLMAQIMSAPLVRCDEIVWDFLGLTMASWNAILSVGLAGMWLSVALWPASGNGGRH